MNELALFAGAGGGILGGQLLGWRTVCAVEIEPYAASVLVARQNDGILAPFPIWDDVRTFDGIPWRGIVDVVSGGFPCQDISSAGKGAGITGERSGLWKEFARIIGEVRPRYAFVENSPMLTVRGLGVVLGDLAEMGYDAQWGIVSAASVGANHERKRLFVCAYANRIGLEEDALETELCAETATHTRYDGHALSEASAGLVPYFSTAKQMVSDPDYMGSSERLADSVDRLKAIGNGQVPAVVRKAWHSLCHQSAAARS